MKENLRRSLDQVFKHEGGYVDHPRDPGGATNMGITFATLQRWRKKKITKADVKALTKAEATDIYIADYARPVRFDDLPSGLDHVTLDASVNSGIGRGPKWTQAALGVSADGVIGPKTIAATKNCNLPATIERACAARMGFLGGLKTWATFGKGWSRRVAEVEALALLMAGEMKSLPQRAATADDKAKAEAKRAGGTAAGGAAGGGGVETTLPDGLPDWAMMAIGAAVVLMVVYFLGRRLHERHRAEAFRNMAQRG